MSVVFLFATTDEDDEKLEEDKLDESIDEDVTTDDEDATEETELVTGGSVSFLEPEPPPQAESTAIKLQVSKKLCVCFIEIILLSAALRDSCDKNVNGPMSEFKEHCHFNAEKLTLDEQ